MQIRKTTSGVCCLTGMFRNSKLGSMPNHAHQPHSCRLVGFRSRHVLDDISVLHPASGDPRHRQRSFVKVKALKSQDVLVI